MLGPGVQPGEIGGPCTRTLAILKLLSIPLVSLDIPSGMPGRRGGMLGAWWGPSAPQLLVAPACLRASVSLAWLAHALWMRVMSIPQIGKTEAAAQVMPCPIPPTPSPTCPLPTLAQLPGQT